MRMILLRELRRTRTSCSQHQLPKTKGLELAEAPRRRSFLLKKPHRQIRGARTDRAGERRRGRRLFCHPLAGSPHRAWAFAAIPAARQPQTLDEAVQSGTAELQARTCPRPPSLARLPG